ncbi:uncharacterized protein [Typha latifolia]|uniref:uncharacterized protein n=1 Tax=Typha latifolia TaxID=4733 RepID=UPI003C2D89FB
MKLSHLTAAIRDVLLHHRPLLRYAAAWTGLLTATVVASSFAPEVAFVWAVSPSSRFARACGGAVRVPLDGPAGEVVCVPARLFGKSAVDIVMPPLFAALVVGVSACFIRAVGLGESENPIRL